MLLALKDGAVAHSQSVLTGPVDPVLIRALTLLLVSKE